MGFIFGKKPNASYHIDYTRKKFCKAVWALNHIKRAGVDKEIMIKVYCVMLRPIVEYCHVIYHSMLTKEQEKQLERLQRQALTIILGFGIEYEDMLALVGIESLKCRREKAFLNFANKLSQNVRYSDWFPLNEETGMNLRKRKKFREEHARTERLFNSPLFNIRRVLNTQVPEADSASQVTD